MAQPIVMLCERGDWGSFPQGPDWIYEVKFDGIRILASKQGQAVKLVGRSGESYTDKFPEVVGDLKQYRRDFILDGELCSLDGDFRSIAGRVHLRDKFRIELNARANPAVYHAFDILNLDGAYLVKHPLRERKRLLDQLGETEHVKIVRPRPLEELTRRVEAQEIEGIVAKDMNSAYELRRSPSWVKYRPNETEDLLCLGWEDSDKSDRPFRSLILKRGNREVQASSGLTHDELETLLNLFAQEPVQKVGTKNYFKTPKIIVEVEYSRRPELSYRFPHIKRIRLDKLAKGG